VLPIDLRDSSAAQSRTFVALLRQNMLRRAHKVLFKANFSVVLKEPHPIELPAVNGTPRMPSSSSLTREIDVSVVSMFFVSGTLIAARILQTFTSSYINENYSPSIFAVPSGADTQEA
jgi:hypothetical protein